jgi:hypothetical protein
MKAEGNESWNISKKMGEEADNLRNRIKEEKN